MSVRLGFRFLAGVLLLPLGASAQNTLDLKEADARDAAYEFMSRVEAEFACELAERSMRELAAERFLVEVETKGEECSEAMTYLVSLADREDRLVFRQAAEPVRHSEAPPFIPPDALIKEINPDVDAEEEDDASPSDPHAPSER